VTSTPAPPLLFALEGAEPLGLAVAQALGLTLSDLELQEFGDGEHKARPLVDVEGRDVFVVQSLYDDGQLGVADKLVRTLFFLGTVRDAGAADVTAVVPYLAYARKDRRRLPGDPVATRHVAQLVEAIGTSRILTMDVHNQAAFENAFRIRTVHLSAESLFTAHFGEQLERDTRVAVVSPDAGGVKRAERFRQALARHLGREVPLVFAEKHRDDTGLRGEALVGDVTDATAILLDDLVASGGTLARAAAACRARGARRVLAAATHGLFTGDAQATLDDGSIDGLVVTDTVPPWRLDAPFRDRMLTVLPTAPLWAEAIGRMTAP
jgi:ribose-phosphate pyrophosphokinase